MSTENQWLNVQDIADLLQVKDETVRRWIRRRELPVLDLGSPRSGYRIRREDLDNFIWQRYRMRNQSDADREFRGSFQASQADADTTAAIRVESVEDSDGSVAPTLTLGAGGASTDFSGGNEQRYSSLMRRMPGVTYVTRVNRETGESSPRHIAFVSAHFESLLGESSSSLRSSDRRWWERVHPDDRDRVLEARKKSHATGERLSIEYRLVNRDNDVFWVRDEAVLGDDSDEKGPLWQGIVLDITDLKTVEESLRARMRQHAAVAELSEHALRESDIQHLMDEAVIFVQQSLDVEYTKVLELLPGGDELLLRAGVGWKPRLAGTGKVSAGAESQAGYTLLSNEPVIVSDLRTESRFNGPTLLFEHGVRSGVSVIIAGHGKPWGVIGAHTTATRTFSIDDVAFLQSVANILASAIRAAEKQQTVRRWLSIRDVADILRVKEETVRRWIRRGELPVIDLGSFRAGYRIHPSDLDHFIQERYMKP